MDILEPNTTDKQRIGFCVFVLGTGEGVLFELPRF